MSRTALFPGPPGPPGAPASTGDGRDAHGRRSRSRATAFTLIELVVVLAMIAILSAVIIPEMRGSFEDSLLRASGRQFIDVFSLANSRAVSVSQTHRVRLDLAAGKYYLERQTGRSSRTATFTPVHDVSGGEGTIDPRITFELRPRAADPTAPGPMSSRGDAPSTRGVEAITFFPDGTADAAELILRDRAGFRLALRVSAVTARVQLTEPSLP